MSGKSPGCSSDAQLHPFPATRDCVGLCLSPFIGQWRVLRAVKLLTWFLAHGMCAWCLASPLVLTDGRGRWLGQPSEVQAGWSHTEWFSKVSIGVGHLLELDGRIPAPATSRLKAQASESVPSSARSQSTKPASKNT